MPQTASKHWHLVGSTSARAANDPDRNWGIRRGQGRYWLTILSLDIYHNSNLDRRQRWSVFNGRFHATPKTLFLVSHQLFNQVPIFHMFAGSLFQWALSPNLNRPLCYSIPFKCLPRSFWLLLPRWSFILPVGYRYLDLHWSNLKLSLADLGETWQVYSINFKDISDSIHPFERIVHTAVGSLYLCFNPAPLFLQSLLSLTPWPLVFSCLIEVGVSENLQYDFFIHSQPRNYIHEEPVIGSLLVCFHNIKNVNLTTSDCLIDTVCLHRKSE